MPPLASKSRQILRLAKRRERDRDVVESAENRGVG
jgi:hypothetical protein